MVSRLRAERRVDLREFAAGKWDRLGFFWYAGPEQINEDLGFSWIHPDAAKVDLFDARHLVLLVVVRGAEVVDHALIPENQLTSCRGRLVTPRENAVFVRENNAVCTEKVLAWEAAQREKQTH